MPTYEFICSRCDYRWNVNCSISEYEKLLKVIKCPVCEYEEVKRIYDSPINFILKGSGWFSDGYNSGGK